MTGSERHEPGNNDEAAVSPQSQMKPGEGPSRDTGPAPHEPGGDRCEAPAAGTDAPRRMAAFFTIWSGQALSLVGSQAAQFALVWWLTLETGSPAVLTTATLLALLPAVVLGPAIGALVDRWSRRRTMIVADGAVALGSVILAGLFLTGRATTATVLFFLFLRALGGAFHGPAMLAATSLMVPPRHLARIQGLNQMLQGGLGILTAPLGAILLGLVGMSGVMAIDVLTAILAIGPLLFVKVPEPAGRPAGQPAGKSPLLGEIAAGLRYLRGLPGHMALIGFAAVINLFLVPAFALLPLLVLEELSGSAAHLAWLSSASGAGVITGGLLLGIWGGFRRRTRTALFAIVGLGLATVALGMTPAGLFPLAVASMLAVGALSSMANGSVAATLQATIVPELQGRVFTLMISVAGAMTPIGLLLATPIAAAAGVRAWYVAGGLVCAAMGSAAFFVRSILAIDAAPAPLPSGGGTGTGEGIPARASASLEGGPGTA